MGIRFKAFTTTLGCPDEEDSNFIFALLATLAVILSSNGARQKRKKLFTAKGAKSAKEKVHF